MLARPSSSRTSNIAGAPSRTGRVIRAPAVRADCPRRPGPGCVRSRTRRRCRGDAQLEGPPGGPVDSASLTSPHPSGLDPAQNGPRSPSIQAPSGSHQFRSGRASAPTAPVAGTSRRGGATYFVYGIGRRAALVADYCIRGSQPLPRGATNCWVGRRVQVDQPGGAECWTKQAHIRCCTSVVASPFARRCWR
jgi:hypothetical protein